MNPDHQTSNPEKVRIPSFLLDGRVAVVTGASQGIGRAFAHAYAAAGAHVIIGSRTRESSNWCATRSGRSAEVPTHLS